jgi:hypothetical protein
LALQNKIGAAQLKFLDMRQLVKARGPGYSEALGQQSKQVRNEMLGANTVYGKQMEEMQKQKAALERQIADAQTELAAADIEQQTTDVKFATETKAVKRSSAKADSTPARSPESALRETLAIEQAEAEAARTRFRSEGGSSNLSALRREQGDVRAVEQALAAVLAGNQQILQRIMAALQKMSADQKLTAEQLRRLPL